MPILVLSRGEPVKKPEKKSLERPGCTTDADQAVRNTHWRQKEAFNLIPSEQTPSLLVKVFSIMDPSGRYAEHRKFKAFEDKEIFYYQGTELIEEVESPVDGRASDLPRMFRSGDKGDQRSDGQYGCLQRPDGLSQPDVSKERIPAGSVR